MAQKILLIEDVENVGRKGDLSTVKSGYAFNYLIPQGLGLIATKPALRRQAKLQEERRIAAEKDKKDSEQIASRLTGESVEIYVKVDHEGHMYGSVSALDIIHLIQAKTGVELEKRMVLLKQPIKEVGVFDIQLRLKEEILAQIHLKIIPEQESR